MISITEEIFLNQTLEQIREAETIIRTYGHLIKDEMLISPKSEMERLFDLASKEITKLQEKYAIDNESSLEYLNRQIEILNKHCGYAFGSSILRKKKVNYYYLVLKKISQIKKCIDKFNSLKEDVFIIFRTGFFFAFKENKKNTP